jgi:hypothetical protein
METNVPYCSVVRENGARNQGGCDSSTDCASQLVASRQGQIELNRSLSQRSNFRKRGRGDRGLSKEDVVRRHGWIAAVVDKESKRRRSIGTCGSNTHIIDTRAVATSRADRADCACTVFCSVRGLKRGAPGNPRRHWEDGNRISGHAASQPSEVDLHEDANGRRHGGRGRRRSDCHVMHFLAAP